MRKKFEIKFKKTVKTTKTREEFLKNVCKRWIKNVKRHVHTMDASTAKFYTFPKQPSDKKYL